MSHDEVQLDKSLVRQASARMAAFLAAMLTRARYDPLNTVPAGEPISGWAISTSEHAEFLLGRLDLTVLEEGHRKVLAKSTAAFPDHFALGHHDDCFPQILESYLDFEEWIGGLPTHRGLFKPPEDRLEILNSLAKLGYLTISTHGYCWTDNVGQVMLRIGVWSPDYQSLQDVKDHETENRAREIASNLSSDLLVLARCNPDAAFGPIFRSLQPRLWYEEAADKLIVERVIEIVRSGSGSRSSTLN